MKWIDAAERKFGHLAIPGLLRWVALVNVVVYIAYKLYPPTLVLLDLDPALVYRGEVWRLATYIFIPQMANLIPLPEWFNAAVFVVFMWWVGDGLDRAWGAFHTNLFYLVGMIGTTIAAFFFGARISNIVLNSSVFFAFARFYGDQVIYMFYVIPAKVKWAAWFSVVVLLITFVPGGFGSQMALLSALVNYLIFFGPEIIQEAKLRREVGERRARFAAATIPEGDGSLHRCEVCGRTERVAPDLDFRVAKDGHEYCTEHLPKAPVAS